MQHGVPSVAAAGLWQTYVEPHSGAVCRHSRPVLHRSSVHSAPSSRVLIVVQTGSARPVLHRSPSGQSSSFAQGRLLPGGAPPSPGGAPASPGGAPPLTRPRSTSPGAAIAARGSRETGEYRECRGACKDACELRDDLCHSRMLSMPRCTRNDRGRAGGVARARCDRVDGYKKSARRQCRSAAFRRRGEVRAVLGIVISRRRPVRDDRVAAGGGDEKDEAQRAPQACIHGGGVPLGSDRPTRMSASPAGDDAGGSGDARVPARRGASCDGSRARG